MTPKFVSPYLFRPYFEEAIMGMKITSFPLISHSLLVYTPLGVRNSTSQYHILIHILFMKQFHAISLVHEELCFQCF